MGNYYCKKCNICLDYYGNIENSRRYNCRKHNYNEYSECFYCNGTSNCRHEFKFYVFNSFQCKCF